MSLDAACSTLVYEEPSRQFDTSVELLADNAVRVADNNIVRAIQLVSTERGRDPRDCVLVPFGGAGPLHAARVAEALNIETICIPPAAGVLSAYGLLAADFTRYDTRTQRMLVDNTAPDSIRQLFDAMKAQSIATFGELGIQDALTFDYTLEMRYVGQAFEVSVAIDESDLQTLSQSTLLQKFNEAHHRLFEFDDTEINQAEVVSFRLGTAASAAAIPNLESTRTDREQTHTKIFDQGEWRQCALLQRLDVPATDVKGPLLIEDDTSTIYIPEDWMVSLDANHNLVAHHQRQ